MGRWEGGGQGIAEGADRRQATVAGGRKLTCSSAGVRSSRRAVCTTMKGLRPAMASVWALGTGFCRHEDSGSVGPPGQWPACKTLMPVRAQHRLQCCCMGRTQMNPVRSCCCYEHDHAGLSPLTNSRAPLPYGSPNLPTCLMYKSGGSMHSMAAASCSSLYTLGSWSSDA